ncbi:putative membrane protein [Mycolicibacterium lutetiense]|uniref:Membrane protein n=1 Tax=Mycolicibacterium lutetiense TaxID=1641992 RepID=A0ABS4ZRM9_9MYCO|nr:putative membrane protein [Mycolicibacterium lutetiense]
MPVGGLIEIVEFDEPRDLAFIGITGVTLRGRFRLRDDGDGRTQMTFRLSYQAPGGVLGLIADRLATRQVGHTLAEAP